MQGYLRNEKLDFIVTSKCVQSGRTLHLELDRDLRYHVQEEAEPLVSVPQVAFATLEDPSIIDAF